MPNKPQQTPGLAQRFAPFAASSQANHRPSPQQQASFHAQAPTGLPGKQRRWYRSAAVLLAWVLPLATGLLGLFWLVFASGTFTLFLSYLLTYLLSLLWGMMCLGGFLLCLAFFLFIRVFGRAYVDPMNAQARTRQRTRRRRYDIWDEPPRYPWVGRGV